MFDAPMMAAGSSQLGYVNLNGPATSDVTVTLTIGDAGAADLPVKTLTIPAGYNSVSFTINAKNVKTTKTFTIMAAAGNLTRKSLPITVVPGPR